MAFDPNLPDWYRSADPGVSEDKFEKRKAGLQAFAEGSSGKESSGLDAVRLFYGLDASDASFSEDFRGFFVANDSTFPASGNDHEMRVLAGCAAHHFSNSEATASSALKVELAFVTLACKGNGIDPTVPEIVQSCQDSLLERSRNIRSQMSASPPKGVNLAIKPFLDSLKSGSLGNHQEVAEKTAEAIDTLAKTVRTVSTQSVNMHKTFNLLQEEVDILWWLFGERARSHDAAFSELKFGSSVLISAFDLADLISNRPGPFASEAFLRKAIGFTKGKKPNKLRLSDAITTLPLNWAEQAKQRFEYSWEIDFCPIHSCIGFYAEVGGDDAWKKRADTHGIIDPDSEFSPMDLAVQFLQEGMLLRSSES